MANNSDVGARIGRSLGETLGRVLGGRAGRALGVWIAQEQSRLGSADEESANAESTEGESTPSSDEEADRPESRADLDDRSYRELQTLAKEVDVTANLSREEMTDRLVEELGIDEGD